MKKNILTRTATVAAALLIVSGLSACDTKDEVALQPDGKPEKISMMATTILTRENGMQQFMDEYKRLTGIELSIEKPEHNQYYEKVAITFAAEEPADVIELGSTYYPSYAAEGILWDMTDAWESSDLKKSGIAAEEYIDGLRCDSEYGENRLYGFPNQRGGGTVTYVRKDWMDALGIENPKNYDEFYAMLKKFKDIKNVDGYKEKYADQTIYPITASGLISTESPYEIYLREFYQDARPDFHYSETAGRYVDGVLEPEMKDALIRLKQAYDDGLMDPGIVTNKTSTCRDKFYNGTVGAFNYWAGTWMKTLDNNIKITNPEAVITPLPSFDLEKEYYIERPATAYVITNFCQHPEEVFKYAILYSHDGGEGQMLFTHGVEDVHYKKNSDGTVEALPCLSDPSTIFEKSCYDAALSITEFDDPIELDPRVTESLDVFDHSRIIYDLPVISATVAEQLPDVQVAKEQLVASFVLGEWGDDVDAALANYASETERQRRLIYEDLNGDDTGYEYAVDSVE